MKRKNKLDTPRWLKFGLLHYLVTLVFSVIFVMIIANIGGYTGQSASELLIEPLTFSLPIAIGAAVVVSFEDEIEKPLKREGLMFIIWLAISVGLGAIQSLSGLVAGSEVVIYRGILFVILGGCAFLINYIFRLMYTYFFKNWDLN